MKRPFLLLLIVSVISVSASSQTAYLGVSLAGADFGSNMPGSYGVE